jgi:hypothetical protein
MAAPRQVVHEWSLVVVSANVQHHRPEVLQSMPGSALASRFASFAFRFFQRLAGEAIGWLLAHGHTCELPVRVVQC